MPVMVSQLEVYYKLDRLLTGLTAQQSITTARRDSNKTTLKLLSNYTTNYFGESVAVNLLGQDPVAN